MPVLSGHLGDPVPSGNIPPPMSLLDFLVPSPPLILSSSLYPSVPLVPSCSCALPQPLAPCSYPGLLRAFRPPARLEVESPASHQASRPLSPPRPVSLAALRSLDSTMVRQPWDSSRLPLPSGSASDCHRSASSCASTLHAFGSTGLLPSSFFVVLTPSASVSRTSSSTVGFQALDIAKFLF